MVDYWPTAAENPAWPERDFEFVHMMNNFPKIIFSRTMDKVGWNARLVKENIAEEILKIKQQPGKDLALFAGSDIASTFIQLGLIDEYRLIVNPVVLGCGKPLFKDIKDKLNLKLLKTQPYPSGITILYYQPDK
jgi:dihydrofolate reductase